MSGRGCSITINVLGGTGVNNNVDELHLPIALHSPLEVLKTQLFALTGIPVCDQVLILLDLTDPERNRDILLIGRDNDSLKNCGFKSGSVLTLHALGMSAEIKQRMTREALLKKSSFIGLPSATKPIQSLLTPITAAQANHSFNGIIFDLYCKSPYEVEITSISLAGMLGKISIFARDRSWEADKPTDAPSHQWFAHNDGISTVGWKLVAEVICRPSWDRPYEITFNQPVRLLPNSVRAFYCHSGLPDDLGIQYQSYNKNDIVAEDEAISIHPGLGHTGSVPFDGWYRSYRSLAGSVQYTKASRGWTPKDHKIFPTTVKDSVLSLLLCNHHLSGMKWNPIVEHTVREKSSCLMSSQKKSVQKLPVGFDLGSLPVFLIYYIAEFWHWDWFVELYGYRFNSMRTLARYQLWKENRFSADPHPREGISCRENPNDYDHDSTGKPVAYSTGTLSRVRESLASASRSFSGHESGTVTSATRYPSLWFGLVSTFGIRHLIGEEEMSFLQDDDDEEDEDYIEDGDDAEDEDDDEGYEEEDMMDEEEIDSNQIGRDDVPISEDSAHMSGKC